MSSGKHRTQAGTATRRSTTRTWVSLLAVALSAVGLAVVPAATSATAVTSTPLVGTFRLDPGAQSAAGAPVTGSYFRMLQPGGSVAAGPYLANANSSLPDQTYTPFRAGTDGGLVTGTDQSQPIPGFDANGGSLSNRIIQPTPFYGVNFGVSTNATDLQTGTATSVPAISVDSSGNLSGDLDAFDASWNNQQFNQGSPKPDGSHPGLTGDPTGSYDANTGSYTLDWSSQIVGGPFNNFTGIWHFTGTFVPASTLPTVRQVNPSSGPEAGGNSVTISGSHLGGATAVTFGSATAAITANSATSVTVTAPAGTGTVDVTVTTPSGTSVASPADEYSYASASAPAVTRVKPNSGAAAGGNTVTITGARLGSATAVRFGSATATIKSDSATSIKVIAPAGSGTVHVTVTTAAGTSAATSADVYTYAEAGGIGSIFPLISLFGPFSSEAASWLPVLSALVPLVSPLLPPFGQALTDLQPVLNVLVPVLNDLEQQGFNAIAPIYRPYRLKILLAENRFATALAPYVSEVVNLPTLPYLQSIESIVATILGDFAVAGLLPKG